MYGTAMMGLLGGSGAGNLFAVTPYTGNGSTQSIVTGQNLAAGGLVWGKETGATGNHEACDTARGATKNLYPNLTLNEQTRNSITAFNSNGFSVGTGDGLNANGDSLVAFSWLKQAGYMDVVTYTGNGANRTIAHSLADIPKLMIVKCRSTVQNWRVYHASLGANYYLELDETAPAAFSGASAWNGTAPTSSVFSVNSDVATNQNGQTFVAYLFAEKAGKSKFGTYTGNGGTNAITGLGFRPKAVLIKNTSSAASWTLTYNDGVGTYNIEPNNTGARSSAAGSVTLDSGGFTLLNNSSQINSSPNTFIYAAWG